jgi:hypothetical protein
MALLHLDTNYLIGAITTTSEVLDHLPSDFQALTPLGLQLS